MSIEFCPQRKISSSLSASQLHLKCFQGWSTNKYGATLRIERQRSTQRFVPDSLKLRTARFEHAHRWFAEQSHIDHAIKWCPLFVDLGDRARSGVQKCSNTICTDIQWELSSHQHLQIWQLSGRLAHREYREVPDAPSPDLSMIGSPSRAVNSFSAQWQSRPLSS